MSENVEDGWQFIKSPELPTDEYWLHGCWHRFVPENWNKHFICGEVGAFYCKIRRRIEQPATFDI